MSGKKHSLSVTCLTSVKTLKDKNYTHLSELNSDIYQHFTEYEINDKTAILTYKSNGNENERLFDNINLLPKNGSIMDLFIKRVWNNCALCLGPFGITYTQIPLECPNEKCGYQYCQECIDIIRKSSDNKKSLRPFLCMFCKKESEPKRNSLLEEHILWRDFQQKYDMNNMISLDSIDFFSYHLILNDLQCRRAHLQSLVDTLSKLTTSARWPIDQASVFVQMLSDLRHRMQISFDALDRQVERPDDLLSDYQKLLSPDNCVQFIAICQLIEQSLVTTLDLTDYNRSDYKVSEYQMLLEPNNLITACNFSIDLTFRRTYLAQLVQQLENSIPKNHPFTSIFNEQIHQAKCLIDDLEKLNTRINTIRSLYEDIALCLLDYYNLLTLGVEGNRCVPLYYSSFVHICESLQRLIEQNELRYQFPILTKQMDEWNASDGCDKHFKPKLVPLFQAIHDDLDNLHTNRQLPYRVGVVGYRSSAKSSLLNRLRNIINDEDPFFSPVALIKSTYCFLQYNIEYDQCAITYVDIEGYDQEIYHYERQINRADCDAYIIVFDQTFSRLHSTWKTWIEQTLDRPCLLVRCKADTLFLDCYPEVIRNKPQYNRETTNNNDIKRVIQAMHRIVTKTESNETLDKVYLAAPKYPHVDERIRGAGFVEFDLNSLRNDLIKLATNSHRYRKRFSRMAMNAGVQAINVCFRRGYVVSATRYSVAAGITAVIPFLEKVPDYLAREKIRQVLGVRGGEETFKKYLLAFTLHVPVDLLQSSVFNYLSCLNNENEQDQQLVYAINLFLSQATIPHQSFTTTQTSLRNGLTIVSDIAFGCARVAARVLQTAQTAASLVTGVTLIFTASMCAWSAFSAEHRMHLYLNKICDDIVCILACFLAKQYKNDQ